MQIPSVPPALINPLPQDVAAKAVPALSAAPALIQRAIDPAPKSEKFNQTRNNRDRAKGGDHPDSNGKGKKDGRGGSVNLKV